MEIQFETVKTVYIRESNDSSFHINQVQQMKNKDTIADDEKLIFPSLSG